MLRQYLLRMFQFAKTVNILPLVGDVYCFGWAQNSMYGFWSVNINNKIGRIYALELATLTVQFHWNFTGKRLSIESLGFPVFEFGFEQWWRTMNERGKQLNSFFSTRKCLLRFAPFNLMCAWFEVNGFRSEIGRACYTSLSLRRNFLRYISW